jgi:tetratricopeptide (TPR) repeat protein
MLRLQEGKAKDAAEDFRRGIALRPAALSAYLNLAFAYEMQGDLDRAMRQLNRAIELQNAAKGQPASGALHRARARLHARRKAPAAMRLDLERAIKLEGQATPPDRQLLAEDHKELGGLLASQGKHAEATREYWKALDLRPDYLPAMLLLAKALVCLAEPDKQLDRDLEAVLQLDRDLEAVLLLTLYLEEAAPRLDAYPKNKESVAEAYRLRGVLRGKLLNDVTEGLDDYTRALALKADSATHARRGWLYVMGGAPKLALRDFQEAVRLDGKSADAHSGRGYALVLLGRHREGVADVEKALRLGPKKTLAPGKESEQKAVRLAAWTRLLYNAARAYAQAAAADETGLAPGKESEQSWRYRNRAVQLLKETLVLQGGAAERGRFWRKYVRGDRYLLPLYRSPGFRKLAARYAGPEARR